MMNYNSETVKTIICEEYAKFIVEKYITEYGIERFQKVKPIFADVVVSIFFDYISSKCTQDEWNESDHPRKENGQFGKGGGGASKSKKSKTQSFTIAGVKQGKPMSFKEARKNLNPTKDINNCSSVCAALEARYRGYNVSTKAFKENNKTMKNLGENPTLAYINPKTGENPKALNSNVNNSGDCLKWLKNNIKHNERYIMSYCPRKGNTQGHTIEVSKSKMGKLVFYDGQEDKIYDENLLEEDVLYRQDMGEISIGYSPYIFRVDNTDLDEEVLNEITDPIPQ